jgi:hypothetical protein
MGFACDMKNADRLVAALCILALTPFAACTSSSKAREASPPPINAATAQPPVWRVPYSPKGGDVITQLQIVGNTVLATARAHVLEFDASSGAPRWQVSLRPDSALASQTSVFVGTQQNTVVALALGTGNVSWRTSNVCPASSTDPTPIPRLLFANGTSVLAGCAGGRLVRLDGASGRIAVARDAFSVDQYTGGAALGPDAVVVEGYSSGATTRGRVAVVRAANLKPIVVKTDATVLGLVGNTAIINDFCCNGRGQGTAPATLLRFDLATGRSAPPIDLQPEPGRLQNLGAGAYAAMVDGHLYFAFTPSLYDYGDVMQPLARPTQVADGLIAPPAFMTHGRALVQLRSQGWITSQLLDLAQRPPSVVWSRTAQSPYERAECPPEACVENQFAELVMLSGRPEDPAVIVRWDGGTAVVPNACTVFAPSGDNVVTSCLPRLLDAHGDASQYLAAFRASPPP